MHFLIDNPSSNTEHVFSNTEHVFSRLGFSEEISRTLTVNSTPSESYGSTSSGGSCRAVHACKKKGAVAVHHDGGYRSAAGECHLLLYQMIGVQSKPPNGTVGSLPPTPSPTPLQFDYKTQAKKTVFFEACFSRVSSILAAKTTQFSTIFYHVLASKFH